MMKRASFIAVTIILLFVTLTEGVFCEEKKQLQNEGDLTDKELMEIYKDLPLEMKKQYQIPEDFFKEYKGDETQPPKKLVQPEREVVKKEEAKPKVKENKEQVRSNDKKDGSSFKKIIDFLFGSGKKEGPQTTQPQKVEIIDDEPYKRNVEIFETNKSEIKNVEQIKGLKPLDEIISTAIKNSPDVQKAKLESEIIKRQNTFTPVPIFNVGNDLATGKTYISTGIQLPLEPLFTGKQREQYGDLNVKQKEKEIEQKCIEQYKLILATSNKLEKRREKIDYARQIVKNADEQYKGGLIKIDELIKAKELQWQAEMDEENLQLDLQTQIEKLKTIEQGGR